MAWRSSIGAVAAFACTALIAVGACGGSDESAGETCDAGEISRALGHSVTVLHCYGDWASVAAPGPGDTQSLMQRVNGTWTRYSDFPSAICQEKAKAAGVPAEELANFTSTNC